MKQALLQVVCVRMLRHLRAPIALLALLLACIASLPSTAIASTEVNKIVVLPVQDRAYARLVEDIWLLIADQLPFATELHVVPAGTPLTAALQQADWVIGLNQTQAENLGFVTGPVLLEQEFVLYHRRRLPRLQQPGDAQGYLVGVVAGEPAQAWLNLNYPQLQLLPFDTLANLLDAALNGQVHVFAHGALLGEGNRTLGDTMQGLRYAFPLSRQLPLYSQPLYIAVRDSDDIAPLVQVREALNELSQRYIQAQRSLDISNLVALQQDELDWLLMRDSLVVGVPSDSSPILFYNEQQQVIGLDADFLNLIGSRSRLEFTYQSCGSWEQCLQALADKRIDILSFITDTPQRRQFASFTRAYWEAPWALATLQREFTQRDTFAELAGMKVAVTQGYSLLEQLRTLEQLTILVVDSPSAGLDAVQKGDADGYLDSLPLLVERVREQPSGNMFLTVLRDEAGDAVSLAVRDDWPVLRDILDRVIETINREDTQRITERWFDIKYEPGLSFNDIKPYLWYASLLVAALLLFFLLWNSQLRREIALRHEAERKLKFQARHDDLTKLPNRYLLDDRLQQAIASHKRHQRQFALLFLDLDGFKQVNDDYGHAAGDALLQQVAMRLQHSVRAQDTVCRFGGDEFVVLLTEQSDAQASLGVAQKLIGTLITPYRLAKGQAEISVSIGVAMYPEHARQAERLISLADKAMYAVKAQGKNGVQLAKADIDSDDI
ncbi:MAG: diguanylate cyclase [Firmicutes bacterium]|nr:diguanylate cyclase [Bacillota bacterium]